MADRPTVLGVKLRKMPGQERFRGRLGILTFWVSRSSLTGSWDAGCAGTGYSLSASCACRRMDDAAEVLDGALRGLGFAPRKAARRG